MADAMQPSQSTDAQARAERAEAPSGAAQRALAEAEARRLKAHPPVAPEINGRGGPDPVRYGDWEVNGLASDF